MDQLIRLMEVVERENIILKERILDVPERIGGSYYHDIVIDRSVIVIDQRLSRREYICVLAEELGHHFTAPRTQFAPGEFAPWFNLPGSYYRAQVSRDEAKGFRWGARYLIPDGALQKAIRQLGGAFIRELTEEFEVTEEFMYRRLRLLEVCRCSA